MPADQLHIAIVQADIVWEDKAANLQQYENYIKNIEGKKEVIVLPEMFSTGFSMAPERLAETMEGSTVQWMKDMARKHRAIITGSVIIEEEGNYYNRLLWVRPDGQLGKYDKRHLFGYADEDKHYTRGNKRLIASVNGWRICLMICYDLRFPVWARNMGTEYDVLLYVANWPEKRSAAWKALLQARAIENMSYVVGVNRVGNDAMGLNYRGESSVFGPLGELLWLKAEETGCQTIILEKTHLEQTRQQLPFLNDADKFMLLD